MWSRRKLSVVVLFVAMVVVVTGCGKAPTEQMNSAMASIAAARESEASTYAEDLLKKAESSLDAAKTEIEAQNQKWFKNFDRATELLATATEESKSAATAASEKKEQVKQDAAAALADARTAIETAREALKSAPRGKGTRADLDLMGADLDGLTAEAGEAESDLESGKYMAALDMANTIVEKAGQISSEIEAAIAKSGGKRR